MLLALLVIGVRLFPVTLDRTGSDVIYFTSLQATGPPAWLVLPVVFVRGRARARRPGRDRRPLLRRT